MEAWRHGGIGMLICLLDEYKHGRVDAWRGEFACFASCAWSASTWLGLGLELGSGLGLGATVRDRVRVKVRVRVRVRDRLRVRVTLG